MARKRKKKELQRDVGAFVGTGVSLGIGTVVVARAGGASVLPAFATAGSMMGPVATGIMAKHALKPLKKLRGY